MAPWVATFSAARRFKGYTPTAGICSGPYVSRAQGGRAKTYPFPPGERENTSPLRHRFYRRHAAACAACTDSRRDDKDIGAFRPTLRLLQGPRQMVTRSSRGVMVRVIGGATMIPRPRGRGPGESGGGARGQPLPHILSQIVAGPSNGMEVEEARSGDGGTRSLMAADGPACRKPCPAGLGCRRGRWVFSQRVGGEVFIDDFLKLSATGGRKFLAWARGSTEYRRRGEPGRRGRQTSISSSLDHF